MLMNRQVRSLVSVDDEVDGLFAQREVQFSQCIQSRLDNLVGCLDGWLNVEVDIAAPGTVIRARAEQVDSTRGTEVAFKGFANG